MPTPILDGTLDKHDLRISIKVDVHGRELKFAKLNAERVVPGGIESPKDRREHVAGRELQAPFRRRFSQDRVPDN